MEGKFRLIYPPGYDESSRRRMPDYSFITSLQIEDMVVIKQETFRGFTRLKLEDYYSDDPEVLEYRLSIIEDLVSNPALYKAFSDSVTTIFNINALRSVMTSDFSVDSALSSVRYLEMYQQIVELFAGALDGSDIRSRGMLEFRKQIREIQEGEEYVNLSRELSRTETEFGYLKSVTLGVNLDENLRPSEAGILSVNLEPFREGTVMERLLKKQPRDKNVLLSSLYPLTKVLHSEELKSLNHGISTSLYTIFSRSLREFEPLVQNYYKINTTPFVMLLDDIRFLVAGTEFILKMRDMGFTMCRPRIAPVEDKICELTNVYNPMLALRRVEDTIVSNSFSLDENGRFYIVTGPNHGGKSIFAYSIGMTQALFQLGLFVPAESAYMSPVTCIYTHFPDSDENNYGKGRLESECARLGEIMKKLTDTDMLIMDESFSSTSGLEAGYIASEVLTGIGIIGCCGLFVTHIHDLPLKVGEYNSHPDNRGKIDNLAAQMEDVENGVRSYRISRTTPDGLSYARDIAKRYGLNLDDILAWRTGGREK